MAEKKTKSAKLGKRNFYEVEAPLVSTEIHLYESEKENLNGKTIKIDLTKNLRGKSLELKMRIKLVGEKLIAEPESLELAGAHIRRVIRKSTDYLEDSFVTECKDGSVRIKPFMMTRRRVSRTILRDIRNQAKEQIKTYLKTRTTKEIFSEIITNKLQKQLAAKLKKIYPLALCEIRVFSVIKPDANKKLPEKNLITASA